MLSGALSAPSSSCATTACQVQSTVEVSSGLGQEANQEIDPLQVTREAAPFFFQTYICETINLTLATACLIDFVVI